MFLLVGLKNLLIYIFKYQSHTSTSCSLGKSMAICFSFCLLRYHGIEQVCLSKTEEDRLQQK